MSVKIVRFQANESQFQKTQRNRCEVNLPATLGFIDLTSSRAIADMHVDVTDAQGTPILLPTAFGQGNMVGAQSLIKNVKVVSQTNGLLDEKRNQNVISSNLDWFLKTRAKEDAESLVGGSTNANYGIDRMNRLPDCPFINYSKPTAIDVQPGPTVTRRAEIPITWSHLDNFSTISQFPILSTGSLVYNVEFEDQIDLLAPAVMPSRAPVYCTPKSAVANSLNELTLDKTVANYWRHPQVGDIVTIMFHEPTDNWDTVDSGIRRVTAVEIVNNKYVLTFNSGFETSGATAACTDIFLFYYSPTEAVAGSKYVPQAVPMEPGEMGSAGSPLIFANNVLGGLQSKLAVNGSNDIYLDTCPWYVGAPVTLTYVQETDLSASPVRIETYIQSVYTTNDAGNPAYDGCVRVVLEDFATLTSLCSAPTLAFRDSASSPGGDIKFTANWVIDEFYLEPFQIVLTPEQQKKAMMAIENVEIPYLKQLLVQKNMPSTAVHTEVITVPAGTVGMSLLTPQNLTLVSGFDSCSQYRWSINGREVTNQSIRVGSADKVGRQIHNQLTKLHFGNLGQQLKKYDAPKDSYNVDGSQATHAFFPLIVPNMPTDQIVQITLIADEGVMAAKNLFFVHHIASMLKISGGKVKIVSSLI